MIRVGPPPPPPPPPKGSLLELDKAYQSIRYPLKLFPCLSQLFLGMYPEEHFIEKPVKEAMIRFRKNLEAIVSVIAERNKNKKLPYYYLSPDRIPNSVAI